MKVSPRTNGICPAAASRLVPSRYNRFVRYDKDNVVGFNFLYRTTVRIPCKVFNVLRSVLLPGVSGKFSDITSDFPEQWLASLQEARFLVDDTCDELALIRFHYSKRLFADNSLTLVVLPTLWCNFSCPYCFELKKPIFMNPEIQCRLVEWVRASFTAKRHIHVGWFGGEPLLAKPTIMNLSEHLIDFANTIGATYSASLTTNGYFLDQQFIDEIDRLHINHIQVTMDGAKPDHDRLRRRRDGGESFDIVHDNIARFCEARTNCSFTLRVNCTDCNFERIPLLLDSFTPAVRARADLFFRWVWANEASGYREFAELQRGSEPFQGLFELYKVAEKKGWRTSNPNLGTAFGYCEVDYLDHYSIAPDGSVFLCSHSYDPREAIGSLRSGDQVIRPEMVHAYKKWYAANPFEDPCALHVNCCQFVWEGAVRVELQAVASA